MYEITPCAIWIKTINDSQLTILNQINWIDFCKKYLQDIQENNIEICKVFEEIIPKNLVMHKSNLLTYTDVTEVKKDEKKVSGTIFNFLSKPNNNKTIAEQNQTYCGFKNGFLVNKRF